jgi:hypothetical protein
MIFPGFYWPPAKKRGKQTKAVSVIRTEAEQAGVVFAFFFRAFDHPQMTKKQVGQ